MSWLHDSAARALAEYRKWLFESWQKPRAHVTAARLCCAAFLLYKGSFPVSAIEQLPESVFLPPLGPFLLLPAYPPRWSLLALSWVGMAATVLFGLGRRPLLYGAVASGCAYLLSGINFSIGYKIDHGILIITAPLLIGFAANELSRSRQARTSWPFAVLALCTGFAMFSSGFVKAASGWLSLEDSSVYGYVLRNYYIHGRGHLLGAHAIHLDWPWLWESLDYSTVVIEMGFLVGAFLPRVFRWIALAMIALHIGVLLLMGIDFSHSIVVYSMLLVWPSSWLARFERLGAAMQRGNLGLHIGLATLVPTLIVLVGSPRTVLGSWFGAGTVALVQLGVLAGVSLLTLRSLTARRERETVTESLVESPAGPEIPSERAGEGR